MLATSCIAEDRSLPVQLCTVFVLSNFFSLRWVIYLNCTSAGKNKESNIIFRVPILHAFSPYNIAATKSAEKSVIWFQKLMSLVKFLGVCVFWKTKAEHTCFNCDGKFTLGTTSFGVREYISYKCFSNGKCITTLMTSEYKENSHVVCDSRFCPRDVDLNLT